MNRAAMALVVGVGSTLATMAAAFLPEPDTYRGEPYRAPVPATLSGAHVVEDDAAHALWLSGRVAFVDVLPRPPRPADLPEGTLWRDAPRHSIPGAIWLPNTGYESLSRDEAALLEQGLARATGGDRAAPVVVFCLSDCWMSWNAARRAVAAGYARVFWYPAGTDGWEDRGWPLEPVAPYQPQ